MRRGVTVLVKLRKNPVSSPSAGSQKIHSPLAGRANHRGRPPRAKGNSRRLKLRRLRACRLPLAPPSTLLCLWMTSSSLLKPPSAMELFAHCNARSSRLRSPIRTSLPSCPPGAVNPFVFNCRPSCAQAAPYASEFSDSTSRRTPPHPRSRRPRRRSRATRSRRQRRLRLAPSPPRPHSPRAPHQPSPLPPEHPLIIYYHKFASNFIESIYVIVLPMSGHEINLIDSGALAILCLCDS